MAGTTTRRKASKEKTLRTRRTHYPACRKTMWSANVSHRTVSTLEGVHRVYLYVRRCRNRSCSHHHRPFRPEAEGRIAFPPHEFGLDVIALIGALRCQQHRSVPEIHQELLARGLGIGERTVTSLLDRYDELLSVRRSDRRHSIRKAVASALPRVAHQWCHFYCLREAARPIHETDRHAKKELKKRVRGIFPIKRQGNSRSDREARAVRGYCSTVRSAITDDGRPPLQANRLKLHGRRSAITASLSRVREKRSSARNYRSSKTW